MKIIVAVCVFLGLTNACIGQQQSGIIFKDPIPFDRDVRFGKLPNGFTYYIKKTDGFENKIRVNFIVKAGSSHEGKGQLGAAHLLEHMAFDPLKHFPNGPREPLILGGLLDGNNFNAHTGDNFTEYFIKVPKKKPNLLDSAIRVARDWADGFLLTLDQVKKETGAVIAEIRNGGVENRRMNSENSKLFQSPKYTTADAEKMIAHYEHFDVKDLQNFYQKWYRADRQAIVIVGDIDVDKVEQKIVDHFSSLKKPIEAIDDAKLLSTWYVNPKLHQVFIKQPDELLNNTFVSLMLTFPRKAKLVKNANLDMYRTGVKDMLINQMTQYRFSALSTLNISSVTLGIEREAIMRAAQVDVVRTSVYIPSGNGVEESFKEALLEVEKLRRFGFSNSELSRAVAAIKSSDAYSRSAADQSVNNCVEHFVAGAVGASPAYEGKMTGYLIDQISLQEINATVIDWLNQLQSSGVIVKGTSGNIVSIDEKKVRSWLLAVKEASIEENKIELKNLPEIQKADSLSVETIASEQLLQTGLRQFKINGINTMIKSISNDSKPAGIILFRCFKTSASHMASADNQLIKDAFQVIGQSGVGGLNQQQIKRLFWGKNLKVSPFVLDDDFGLTGSCNANDLREMMQLICLNFLQPNRNEEAFNSWVKEQGSLGKVTRTHSLDDMHSAFKQYFAVASDFTFVFTGDINEANYPLVFEYLGSLSSFRKPPIQNQNVSNAISVNHVKVDSRGNSSRVNITYSDDYDYNELASLKLQVLAEYLQIKLFDRIRNKEGATYDVTCYANTPPKNNYKVSIAFETDSAQAKPMISVVNEEIELLKKEGLDPSAYQRSLSTIERINASNLDNSFYWLKYLVSQCKNDDDLAAIQRRASLLKSLTPDDIQTAAIRYLTNNN